MKSTLIATLLASLLAVEPGQTVELKTDAVPSIAVHEGKLHVVFGDTDGWYLRDGQYDLESDRWISADRIRDQAASTAWARSWQSPVILANTHEGISEITRWMDLAYVGIEPGVLWTTALRPGIAPHARHWDTMREIPDAPAAGGAIGLNPIGAARHRWRGGLGLSPAVAPLLTVAFLRGDNMIHLRVLTDEPRNGWSGDATIPGTRLSVDGGYAGVSLISSRAGGHLVDGVRSPALYAFWTDQGIAGVEGMRVFYRRLLTPDFARNDWDPLQFLPPSLPQVARFTTYIPLPEGVGVVTQPGPLGVADHPWGLLVGYLGGTGADSAPTGGIHLAFSTDGDTDGWVGLGRDNAPVSNMIDSRSNPALTVHGGQIYIAYIPRNITPGDWFDHELCVGIIDPFASGGPEFRSLRTDLPMTEDGRRYCETE